MKRAIKWLKHFAWVFRKNYRAEVAGPYPYHETSTMPGEDHARVRYEGR